jgi:hypothetical protein
MLGAHFIVKCRVCKSVMSQCRCPSLNKEIRFELCAKCSETKAATRHVCPNCGIDMGRDLGHVLLCKGLMSGPEMMPVDEEHYKEG